MGSNDFLDEINYLSEKYGKVVFCGEKEREEKTSQKNAEIGTISLKNVGGNIQFELIFCKNRILNFRNTGGEYLFIDGKKIIPGETFSLPRFACFLYDEDRSFVFGIDSKEPYVWEVDPQAGIEIEAKGLKQTYSKGRVGIKDVTFEIPRASFIGIYGGSGTGKSVLLEKILGPQYHSVGSLRGSIKNILEKLNQCIGVNSSGSVKLDGEDVYKSVSKISFLPQHVDFPNKLKCKEILKLAMLDRGCPNDLDLIFEKLKLCSLDENILNDRYCSLSGGQKRRIALAAALLRNETKLLIADEPTTGLDFKNEMEVMNSLRKISRHGVTVIVVTHSIESCRKFDKVFVLKKRDEEPATIVFKSKWVNNNFPQFWKKFPDGEKLTRLTSSYDNTNFPENKDDFPFEFKGDKSATTKKQSIFHQIKNTFLQLIFWWISSWRLERRDMRGILIFFLLSMITVIAIWRSISNYSNYGVLLATLVSIAAPWLCSTYAAIHISGLLKFFAWENFSGSKPVNFVYGTFASFILPSIIISSVFTVGALTIPDNDNLIKSFLTTVIPKEKDNKKTEMIDGKSVVKYKLCETCCSIEKCEKHSPIIENNSFWLLDRQLFTKKFIDFVVEGKNFPFTAGPDNKKSYNKNAYDDFYNEINDHYTVTGKTAKWWKIGIQTEWNDQKQWGHNDNYKYSSYSEKDEKLSYSENTSIYKIYINVWARMIFLCMIGCSLGIFAATLFRDVKNATLSIVVLYIFYILFSRLFIVENCAKVYLLPLEEFFNYHPQELVTSGGLYLEHLVPILITFAMFSRYATNILCCYHWQIILWDVAFLVFVGFLALTGAVFCLSNKRKNWRLLSR